ncbi:hypothetical protein HS7_03430 [Sulfolobales archaeon HS-7]|nr:hypothetical protein HS7_03430 [Sulfolobales archaeon HS-7]
MNRDIGKSAERELVHLLSSMGFRAVRIPTSNSSMNPLPDVFAVRGELLLAFEVKSTWEKKLKIREIQVEKVRDFLSLFPMRGRGIVAVKFKSIHKWKGMLVDDLNEEITLMNSRDLIELLSEEELLVH